MKPAKYVLICFSLIAPAFGATLTLSGTTPLGATGLGAVPTILTASGEGCVAWSGTADIIGGAGCAAVSGGIAGDTNLNKTRTWTLAELGIGSESDVRLIFNPAETGSDQSLTLTSLVLMIFGATTGDVLLTATLPSPEYIDVAGTGTGSSGFVFLLSGSAPTTAFANSENRLGLAFTTTGHDGADETFFQFGPKQQSEAVPEPATFGFVGAALVALSWKMRRRR